MDLEYEQMGDYLIPKLKANPEPEGMVTKYGLEGQISEGEIRWGENSNVSGRNAESTSSRDSGTGKREDGSPDIPDGGERRSKRTAQSTGSDALGEEDEQHPEPGGGSRTERTDLQPTNFVKPEESYTQLSLFPSAEEQRGSITAAEASKNILCPLLSICRKPILK